MSIRQIIAGCALLAAATTPASFAQKVAPAAPRMAPPIAASPPVAPPVTAPIIPPPIRIEPYLAPKADAYPVAPPLSASADVGGAPAAAAAAPAYSAAPPPAPGYSDLCRASPKPPWCADDPTPSSDPKN